MLTNGSTGQQGAAFFKVELILNGVLLINFFFGEPLLPVTLTVRHQNGNIMRVCIHRGSKQIGGSCVEIESCGQRLLVDLGLPLDAEENHSRYLPQINGLDGNDSSLLGVLISHSHLDHFGLLAHISPKIPVGMGAAARRILGAAAPFLPGSRPIPSEGWDYQSGNVNLPQSSWSDVALYVPQAQRIQIKENAWFDLLKRHSANRIFIEHLHQASNKSTLLFRPLHRFDLERGGCLSGAIYIYSQWEGYWEQGLYDRVKDWLIRHSIPKHSIHTSGHASPGELQRLVTAINPRSVVPIHSFYPDKYSELFPNVETHNDGEWWEV